MSGEKNLVVLLQSMQPVLNKGEYVFCQLAKDRLVDLNDIICFFREDEANTIIIPRALADKLHLHYHFVAAWITLNVHSSLDAVGLTAAFSQALSAAGISCNVVAAFYHDHIFVRKEDAEKAMQTLHELSGL